MLTDTDSDNYQLSNFLEFNHPYKFRSYHDKGNGVDINKIDEIDTFEKSIQNRYNDLYLKMHQTSKLTLPSSASQKLSFENSDHSDIEDYEKLYFDSYNAHVMKQQVKEFEQKHMEKGKDFLEACQNKDRAVIGRLFVGKTLFQVQSGKQNYFLKV